MSKPFQLLSPSRQEEIVLSTLKQIQPVTFERLLERTGFPDAALTVLLNELVCCKKVSKVWGYYYLWTEIP